MVVMLLLLLSGDVETNPGPFGKCVIQRLPFMYKFKCIGYVNFETFDSSFESHPSVVIAS